MLLLLYRYLVRFCEIELCIKSRMCWSLPEEAPVMRATPGKRVEGMFDSTKERKDNLLEREDIMDLYSGLGTPILCMVVFLS